jgi:hypothetical protein
MMNNKKKINQIRNIAIWLCFGLSFSFGVSKVFASASVNPEMLVGKASLVQGGKTYYGGMTGNYAVLNNDPNSSYGFDNLVLPSCLEVPITTSPVCFILGTGVTV